MKFRLLFFLSLCFRVSSTIIHEVNEALFLDPRTHSALIVCPLESSANEFYQWFDVANHRYENERGRSYRINGTQPLDREYLCSLRLITGGESDEKYRMKIRTYGKTSTKVKKEEKEGFFRSAAECSARDAEKFNQYEYHHRLGR